LIAALTANRDEFLRLVNTEILQAAWKPNVGLAGQKPSGVGGGGSQDYDGDPAEMPMG
jgi:hypothetical protein